MNDFDGKTIWIIGASSGIGYALAKELAGHGARLILSARREDKLRALNEELGGGHVVCAFDIGDVRATRDAMAEIGKACPVLDSAIFMAAVYSFHDGKRKDIDFMHEMMRVNVGGAFNMVDAAQPVFERQGYGQIVLCASIAGYRGLPTGQPYCAGKAALINYAESLKIDLERVNIDVKVICPGFVETPLTDKNDFPMPMMVGADIAAREIAKGLKGRGFEIHFPKRMTVLMKILRVLPTFLYFVIVRRLR